MEFIDPSLPKEISGWRSDRLGMDMPIVRYGRSGHGLLLFPTAAADFLENERFFLIKAIEPLILAGKVQIFCIDSINKHAWMNTRLPVAEQARRQSLYSAYIEQEVVPHIRNVMNDQAARLAVSGASFGAFHAANVFFRRPDLFDTLIAMSGFYDLAPDYLDGHGGDEIFYNNPMWFVRGIAHPETLETLRKHSQIFLVTGQGRWEHPVASERFSELLEHKAIPHTFEKWGFDVEHDWPWWRRMLPHFIGERVRW